MNSLKVRFFLLFTGLGVLVALGVGLVMYVQYHNYIRDTYRKTLIDVAHLVERQFPVLTDTDYLIQEATVQSEQFWELCSTLDTISDALGLAYIYYMDKINGSEYRYLLSSGFSLEDTEGWLETVSPLAGEIELSAQTRSIQITKKPITDEWGTYISAFLPIVERGGVVGVLGVDYYVTFIQTLERRAVIALFVALVIAAGISIVFALTISTSVTKPIRYAITALKTIAGGDLTQKIEAAGTDELGDMMRFLS
jgi:methyl-accepting chemotaxis protein